MNMDFTPKKSWFKDQPEITLEGRIFRVQHPVDNKLLEFMSEEYLQHEWLRLYEKIIQEVAKMGMGTRDYFVLKITPIVREISWGEYILQIEAEINAVRHKEVSVPIPHFEPYPITFSYLFKQWKADTKYNIQRWWKRLFK